MSSDNEAKFDDDAKTAATEATEPEPKAYNCKEVWWKEVRYADGTQMPFNPMKIEMEERHKPFFFYAQQHVCQCQCPL